MEVDARFVSSRSLLSFTVSGDTVINGCNLVLNTECRKKKTIGLVDGYAGMGPENYSRFRNKRPTETRLDEAITDRVKACRRGILPRLSWGRLICEAVGPFRLGHKRSPAVTSLAYDTRGSSRSYLIRGIWRRLEGPKLTGFIFLIPTDQGKHPPTQRASFWSSVKLLRCPPHREMFADQHLTNGKMAVECSHRVTSYMLHSFSKASIAG